MASMTRSQSLQLLQADFVVGGTMAAASDLAGQRRRAQLAEVGDGLEHDAIGIAFLRGQVEQDGVDPGVGEVRGDLRTHDAGTQHGGAPYKQFLRHVLQALVY